MAEQEAHVETVQANAAPAPTASAKTQSGEQFAAAFDAQFPADQEDDDGEDAAPSAPKAEKQEAPEVGSEDEDEDDEEPQADERAPKAQQPEPDEEGDEEEEDEGEFTLESLLQHIPKKKLIALGRKAVERELQRAVGLEPKAEQGSERDASASESRGEAAQPAALERDAERKTLEDELGIDAEAAEKVLTLIHARQKSLEDRVGARLTEIENSEKRREGQAAIDKEMRRLEAEHPRLKTDRRLRDKLTQKALMLAKSHGYKNDSALFDDAVRLVPEITAPDLAQKRRNGASTPPPTRGDWERPPADAQEHFERAVHLIFDREQPEKAYALPKPPPTPSKRRRQ